MFGGAVESYAAGISVDAGLTPSEDRWILRSQIRYMSRSEDPTAMGREMERYVFPLVVAYGLRSDVTLFIRQILTHQKMTMGDTSKESTGLTDTFLFAKYRAFRLNTRAVTFGIAPTLGIELPSGKDGFTSDTWDLKVGMYGSSRMQTWASDINIAYKWNGFKGENGLGINPGDELSLDLAGAYQFGFGEGARTTIAPVVELSYLKVLPNRVDGADAANSGEEVLYLSPGVKLTTTMLIFEMLVRLPAWQSQEGMQLERDAMLLAGMRVLL
jgi:hypothetical protein